MIDCNLSQFMGEKGKNITAKNAKFAVIPVPYEKTTSYGRGAQKGPFAVISASSQIEFYDEEVKKNTFAEGIFTYPAINCKGNEKTVLARIEKTAREILKQKAVPFFIGGEHTITQPLFGPFLEKYPNLSILHFDAHADLRPSYDGTKHNHACALYPASKKCRIVQVGIRSVAGEEKQFINSGNVKTFLAHDWRDNKKLIKEVLKPLTKNVYLSIDVDGFDPSVMPATGTPQPGGFGWYEGLDLFRAVCKNKNIVGADIVEVAPVKGNTITEFAAAKLAYRLMGYINSRN